MNLRIQSVLALLAVAAIAAVTRADDAKPAEPQTFKLRVTGLFCPVREEHLRELIAEMPDIELVSVDYDRAEAQLRFDPKTLFPGAKPEQLVERLDMKIRQACRGTFGVRPLCEIPKSELTRVEIGIVGLDCLGCSLGAYDAVYRIEGVEQATASFHDGLVIAWIDTRKTSQTALEEALEKRRVTLAKSVSE